MKHACMSAMRLLARMFCPSLLWGLPNNLLMACKAKEWQVQEYNNLFRLYRNVEPVLCLSKWSPWSTIYGIAKADVKFEQQEKAEIWLRPGMIWNTVAARLIADSRRRRDEKKKNKLAWERGQKGQANVQTNSTMLSRQKSQAALARAKRRKTGPIKTC